MHTLTLSALLFLGLNLAGLAASVHLEPGPGIPLGAAACFALTGSVSAWGLLAATTFRQLHELDIHSGLTASVSRWLPVVAPPSHHAAHHRRGSAGNFASLLLVWDTLLGTRAR